MRIRSLLRTVLCGLAAGLWVGAASAQAAPRGMPQVAEGVRLGLGAGQVTEALVLLDDAPAQAAEQLRFSLPAAGMSADNTATADGAARYAARIQFREAQLDALKASLLATVAGSDLQVLTRYSVLPVLHVRMSSPAALARLVAHPQVRSIDAIQTVTTNLSQSLPLIRQPQAAAAGQIGTGTTVAVLDTGVDYAHPAFGSCAAPGGACKVAVAVEFAPEDGARDADGHGTNVAATVLGVAPGARIAALDVFNGATASGTTLLNAINWVVAQKATYNIAAVNMSLGGGSYTSPIAPTDSFGVALQAAVNAGVVVAVSSGNERTTNAMSWPAAYSNVVSVGAVYDSNVGAINWSSCSDTTTAADKVTCFSNSASFLSVLAPGALITAGGSTMGGTSQAAPHVAGAAAVLRAAFPSATTAALITRLTTGTPVTDHRNGITKPRLDLVQALGTGLTYTLSVARNGSGTGTVGSNPAGISCGSDCSEPYASGTSVTLTATAASGSVFAGWSGACTGTASTCTVSMTAALSVTATFNTTTTYALTVARNGTGTGTVTSSPAGISCGADCSEAYTGGTSVTLTATPATGSVFAGWSGGCTGTATTCTVSMTVARSVTATFNTAPAKTLTVGQSGTGSGTVGSSPAGISCGADCSEAYPHGTSVTLTATPALGSEFAGWSGACTGTATTCTVSMTMARSVTATFNTAPAKTLTVGKSGTGSGTVASSPAGISCGADCSEAYLHGTSVTLTATAATGSVFAGWSGACTGTASTCTVGMSVARSVTASFNRVPQTLSVLRQGAGVVTSSPAGIDCGATCTASFAGGSTVTLTATPATGWQFKQWSGACTGTASTCTVSMTQARSVTATFAGIAQSAIGTAVEAPTLPWSGAPSSGSTAWRVLTMADAVGGSAAASGVISHYGATTLRTVVTGPGLLQFRWRVSSESNFDWLTFSFNGWEQVSISGVSGWLEAAWLLPAGTHTLAWTYAKDGSLTAGADAGYLDNLRFTAMATSAADSGTPQPGRRTGRPVREVGMVGEPERLVFGPVVPK